MKLHNAAADVAARLPCAGPRQRSVVRLVLQYYVDCQRIEVLSSVPSYLCLKVSARLNLTRLNWKQPSRAIVGLRTRLSFRPGKHAPGGHCNAVALLALNEQIAETWR
jgi:hypothetical protein